MDPNSENEHTIIEKLIGEISDTDLPKILFLFINPNNVLDNTNNQEGPKDNVSKLLEENSKDNVSRLLKKYQEALQNKSLQAVRNELSHQLHRLLAPKDHSNSANKRNDYFADDTQVSETEEDILAFHEILEMYKYSVPEKFKQKYKSYITSMNFDERSNFFIYAENKLLMHICNNLTEKDVYKIYETLCNSATEDVKQVNINCLSTCFAQLNEESIEKVKGLKEVAFFHVVLTLMKANLLNRLHTQPLKFALEILITFNKEKGKEYSYIHDLKASLDRYPVTSRPTGLCIIFCMLKDRPGANKDLQKVENLFEKTFKYDVIVRVDPTQNVIQFVKNKLSGARNKFYDSLVVFFMSHGDENFLEVTDGGIHRRTDLIKPICNIEWFFKKPKLFFIQACAAREKSTDVDRVHNVDARPVTQPDPRSWRLSAGSNWQTQFGDNIDFTSINPMADTLVSNATMWYEKAARNEEAGSIYINTLVDQLREYGCSESIENVLHRVHINVNSVKLDDGSGTWKQAPYFESSLQKAFIFPSNDN